MTLIELLVVIVIVVTVLAGVIPMLSPNNDARKIRETARQLNSMIAQAQAQAARDGRAVGVAFREFGDAPPRSGMAYEAFVIAEPPPYAGFAENSQVRLLIETAPLPPLGPGDVTQILKVQFVLAGQPVGSDPEAYYPLDPVPPSSIRRGDVLHVSGYQFVINDLDRNGDGKVDNKDDNFAYGDFYDELPRAEFAAQYIGHVLEEKQNTSDPPKLATPAGPLVLAAVMPAVSGDTEEPPAFGWTTPRAYRIERQPRNTSDQPVQFPRGIGIDLDVSDVRGSGPNLPPDFDRPGQNDVVGMMFGPTGSLDGFYFNGVKREGVDEIFLLLGRGENGNNGSQNPNDYDFSTSVDDDELAARRQRLNWLNADSTWLRVGARSGRISTDEVKTFDPRHSDFTTGLNGTPEEMARQQRGRQIKASRQYAESAEGMGGR